GCILLSPGLFWHQVMHEHNQHVLIMRAIENGYDPPSWSDPVNTPEEIMRQIPVCRRFKRMHFASLGIDLGEDLENSISLTTRIHPLQHYEQAMMLCRRQQLL